MTAISTLTTCIGTCMDTLTCTHSFTHIIMNTHIIIDYNELQYLHFSIENLLFLFNTHILYDAETHLRLIFLKAS